MTDTVILLLAVLLAGIVLVILVRNGWRFSGLSTFAVSIIAAIVSTTGAYLALLVYLRFLSHSVWSQPERGVRGHQAPWPFTVWTAGILGVCFLVTLIIVCVLVNRKRSGPTRFAAPLLAPLVAAAVVVTGGSTFFALRIAPLSAGEARLSYAVWFRTQRAWRDVVDFNEGTAELTFREPYWLKFALSRDAKFFTPPEHQIGPPSKRKRYLLRRLSFFGVPA